MVSAKNVNTSFRELIEDEGKMCYILITDLESQRRFLQPRATGKKYRFGLKYAIHRSFYE